MARIWLLCGLIMAWIWFEYGWHMAWIWLADGLHMAWIWFEYGLNMAWIWLACGLNIVLIWRSLLRTTVILTSGASVPGVVHHAPCLGSAGSASSPAVPISFFRCKIRYLRSRVIWKVKKHNRFLTFVGHVFQLSCKNQHLRFRVTRKARKHYCFLFFLWTSVKIVVLSFKTPLPPVRPLVLPSARPSVRPGQGRPNLYT